MSATNRLLTSFGLTVFLVAGFLADPEFCAAAPTPVLAAATSVYTAAETAKFKALAKQTIAALVAGKKSKMVAKLTDLETVWDEKENLLSPKDPATWTLIDKTLDRGISALRSSKTDLPKGKVALQDFISELDQATQH